MGVKFQIADSFIDVTTIKEYRLEKIKYIYRPRYLKNKTLVNKISHKVYTYKDMEPYKPYDESLVLEDVPYAIVNANGFLEEEKGQTINKYTQEFHYAELRTIDCLVIVADKEYVFYGSGIDCANARINYERLNLLIKNSQKSTKKAEIANKILTEGQNYTQKGTTWFKGLNTDKKIIVGCIALLVVILLICAIGAAIENNGYEETTNETTTVYVSETTTKEETTESVTETTENIADTTEKTTLKEKNTESTTEIETVVGVVDVESETEKIESTTKKKNGRIVYITPTGEKYHCSSSCAGKNAMEREYDDIEGVYDPCKKCAY